jgi:hypothetical protein
MSELNGVGYEGTAVEHPPPADASREVNGGQDRATGSAAGEEHGELLTRDEYTACTEHAAAVGDAPEQIEEADLASIDAYEMANEQAHEPLTRDEFTGLADQRTSAADDGAPGHIEEADFAAIDAYDTGRDQAASHAQDEDPSEEPGGDLNRTRRP